MIKRGLIAAAIAAILTSAPLHAATATARMDVTANVVLNCRLTVPALSFGSYDPLAAHSSQPADASTVVTVTCTRNAAASLWFDSGLHVIGSDRGMSGPGAENLRYQIYLDPAHSQVWGQGADALKLSAAGVMKPNEVTVFGRIPAQQDVPPGAYSDVLTAVVDF